MAERSIRSASGPLSPWAAALGTAVDELHPRIRDYVQAIPLGSVGRGTGVFEVVGTPRRMLWPVFWVLARKGVVAPVWLHDVPFEIANQPQPGADPRLAAQRTFALPGGLWTMRDAVSFKGGALTDDLGSARRYRVALHAWAEGGALRLRSSGVTVRVGRMHLPLPRLLAPVVHLREEFDEALGRQRVHLRLTHPVIGLLYEYRGTFEYRIEEQG